MPLKDTYCSQSSSQYTLKGGNMVIVFVVVIHDSKPSTAIPEVCSPHHQHMHTTFLGPFLPTLCVLEKWLGTSLGNYCSRHRAGYAEA